MNDLARMARHRAVMTTIADVIVAAAVGRSLRVAVGSTHPDELVFADHLTQALIARGRPCRCLPAPTPALAAGSGRHRLPDGPNIAVLLGGATSRAESAPCRVDIRLRSSVPVAPVSASPHLPTAGEGHSPDIVVDYLNPDGPTIRYMADRLTADRRQP
jgi:hypothetical protein